MMKHMTNQQLRNMYLGFLSNFMDSFWKDIEVFNTPEEAILRFEGVYNSSAFKILKEREVFTKDEYRILYALTEIMIYIFNSHSHELLKWNKLTDDEEMIIFHLFTLIQKNMLEKEEKRTDNKA